MQPHDLQNLFESSRTAHGSATQRNDYILSRLMDKLALSDIKALKKLPANVQKDITWLFEDATIRRNRALDKLRLKFTTPARKVVLLAPRKTPPIFKPHLPTELMTMILEHLDLYSLRSFSLVNSACLPIVKNV